jgi:hypothetical protein
MYRVPIEDGLIADQQKAGAAHTRGGYAALLWAGEEDGSTALPSRSWVRTTRTVAVMTLFVRFQPFSLTAEVPVTPIPRQSETQSVQVCPGGGLLEMQYHGPLSPM